MDLQAYIEFRRNFRCARACFGVSCKKHVASRLKIGCARELVPAVANPHATLEILPCRPGVLPPSPTTCTGRCCVCTRRFCCCRRSCGS